MGSKFAASFPILGSQPVSIHRLSGRLQHPLDTTNPALMPGERTLPIPGAPRVPPNPLLSVFRQQHKK
jgi:hypothetical protein